MLMNSATLRPKSERLPSPHRNSIFYFSLAGGILFFGMGDGARSGFFKEEAAQKEYRQNTIQIQNRACGHHIILMFMIKGNQTLGIRLGQFR